MLVAVEAVFEFPAVSVNVAPATEMDPDPDCVSAVGVNTTEYAVEDVVVSGPMVPPVTVMSSAANVVDASDRVKVIVSVCPALSGPVADRVKVTVGVVVSIVTARPEEVDVTVESDKTVRDSAVMTLSPAVKTPVSHDQAPVELLATHVFPDDKPSTKS